MVSFFLGHLVRTLSSLLSLYFHQYTCLRSTSCPSIQLLNISSSHESPVLCIYTSLGALFPFGLLSLRLQIKLAAANIKDKTRSRKITTVEEAPPVGYRYSYPASGRSFLALWFIFVRCLPIKPRLDMAAQPFRRL